MGSGMPMKREPLRPMQMITGGASCSLEDDCEYDDLDEVLTSSRRFYDCFDGGALLGDDDDEEQHEGDFTVDEIMDTHVGASRTPHIGRY